MRIAHISVHGCPLARLGEKDTGGMNVYILQLARELGTRGIEVDVFTRTHDSNDPSIARLGANARVIHIDAGQWNESKEDIFPHLPEFLCNLRYFVANQRLQYHAIHSHYWLSGWIASILKGKWDAPHVFTPHTLGIGKKQALPGQIESALRIATEKRIIAEAESVIASTNQEKELLISQYKTAPSRIASIPAGVDINLFKPSSKREARAKLGLSKQRVILFVGRIDPIKGLDILLNAVALLKDPNDVLLLVVGGRPEVEPEFLKLLKLCEELGIQEHVKIVGAVPQEQLPTYYNAADVCVVPSFYESFGMVSLEAMACGLPVLASKVGIAQSVIKDGENGYLLPWHCPQAFADKLHMLLTADKDLPNMGTAARASVLRFNWESVTDQILALYQRLAESASRQVIGI